MVSIECNFTLKLQSVISGSPNKRETVVWGELNRYFDLFVEFVILIVFKFEVVDGEVVEILDVGVHLESRSGERLFLQNFFDDRNVSVIDVRIAYDVHEFADLKTADLRKHMHEHGILHDVPVVCRQCILASLIENCVEFAVRDVEGHRIRARVKVHFV